MMCLNDTKGTRLLKDEELYSQARRSLNISDKRFEVVALALCIDVLVVWL